MDAADRDRFDQILEEVLGDMPPRIHEMLEEVPLIVEDCPSRELLDELAREAGEDPADWDEDSLCGLHTGTANTERTVDLADLPSHVNLYRMGIIAEAGGFEPPDDDPKEDPKVADDAVYEQIRVTLLHELGHQFGLDEDDLARLGYE
jgi:predicted Zn-dependent protease with MMP-like domain